MEFMSANLDMFSEELKDNLFIKLDYDEQESVEKQLKDNVIKFSRIIESFLQKGWNGVKLEFDDNRRFSVYSVLINDNIHRGIIHCSRLFLIGNYQMFYGMDYSNIVTDEKNIDNIKKLMFNMSMMCTFWHELAHIYGGHLKLYNQWKKEDDIKNHSLDIQTLEWDADSFAATKMAEWILGVNKNILEMDQTDLAMKIACGAIHGMMYWQRTNSDFDKVDSKEHPPIFYREVAMLKCIGDLRNNLEDILRYIIGYEKEFNRIRRVGAFDIKKYFENSRESMEYMSKIENNWEKIRNKLQNYSVLPLEELKVKDYF